MYENIKELINNSNYNEAKKIIVEELKNNENEELWYLLFLAENNNYLDFDPNNINNTYAYNQATKSNNEIYELEFKLYKELSIMNLNKLFRLIQIEKYDDAYLLMLNKNKFEFKLTRASKSYFNYLINTLDASKLFYYSKFVQYVCDCTNDDTANDIKDKLNGFIAQRGIDLTDDLKSKGLNYDDYKIENDSIIKYNGRDSDIIIPKVKAINEFAFNYSKSINVITLPNTIKKIGKDAFSNCDNLTKVYYDGTILDWCDIKFAYTSSNPMSFAKDFYILDPNGSIVHNNKRYSIVTDIDITSNITKINDYSFWRFKNLTNISIPDSITSIGDWAFAECVNLKSIDIPSNVKSVGDRAFYKCSSIENIVIPDGVEELRSTFSDCINLKSITIPKSVNRILGWTFSNCNNLKTIYYSSSFYYYIENTLPNELKGKVKFIIKKD